MTVLIGSLWAGLFAGGLAIILTAPPRYIAPTVLCGFAGRLVRDLCMGWGLAQNPSTVVASAVIVLVAAALIRRRAAHPVVLVSAIIPLGAAVAMFQMIIELIRVSSLTGEPLNTAVVALNANMGKVFTTCLAIALGLAAGQAVAGLLRGKALREKI